jgi:Helix-turn-helix domain
MSNSGKPTVTRRILTALKTGSDFTTGQLQSRFGIVNVSARIAELRKIGYPIYLNTKTTSSGNTISVYRLGAAPRETVLTGQVIAEKRALGYSFVDLYDVQAEVATRLGSSF